MSELKSFLDFLLAKDKSEIPFWSEIDWPNFIEFGGNLKSLFFSVLSNKDSADFEVTKFRQLCSNNELKNKYLLDSALELSSIFKQAQVDAVFYKGVALLSTIYSNNMSARLLRDIDFIVPISQQEKAKQVLIENNFIEDYSERGLGTSEEARDWFEANHFHSVFRRGDLEVELHRNISYSFDIEKIDLIFKTSINAGAIKIPAVEFQIIIALLNFIHDNIMNRPARWYLEPKSTGYFFVALCYELKLICEHYKSKINQKVLKNLILLSGEERKIKFLLCQISLLIDEPILASKAYAMFEDPLKCLVSSSVLFENVEVPRTDKKVSNFENLLRFLFLFSKIKPRQSPLGKAIFWLHCTVQVLLFPFNKARLLLKPAKL